MRSLRISAVVLLIALGCAALGTIPVSAADIDDLGGGYLGTSHHNTNPGHENDAMSLNVSSTNTARGTFTGTLNGVSVTGKVTNKGVVTCSGTQSTMSGSLRVRLKGQLSATGLYIVGTLTIDKATGSAASVAGKRSFRLTAL
jgi:hypothetical protein